jgi:RNA polymerase-binding transcription factor DksA
MDADDARRRLEAERSRVEGLLGELRADLDNESESDDAELSDYDQHQADAGTETFEREKDLSILESLETELAEIEAAVERIDNGTYGVDEVTGKPIDAARLEAQPTARTNVGTPGADRRPS